MLNVGGWEDFKLSFLKLIWGFIFLFDINIYGLDILPDVFGYILIFVGLRELGKININLQVAKKIAFILIFFSIFDILTSSNLLAGTLFVTSIAIYNLIYVIINLIMVYRIISGISELAKITNNFNLEVMAINTWKLFFVFNVIVIIYIIIPINILSWLVSIFSIFIYLIILFLLNETKNKISLPKKSRVYYTL